MKRRRRFGVAMTVGLAGCGGGGSPVDAATAVDARLEDAAPEVVDAGPVEFTARWERLANAPSIAGKQDDVFFVSAERGLSVNGLGQIWRTTDRGESWTQVLDRPGTYFRAITFVDAQRGFAGNIGVGYYPDVTDETPLFETHDGGDTWAPVTSITGPTPRGICNFHRIDADHLVASGRVGGPSFLLTSSDGGATWQSRNVSARIGMLIDTHFVSPTEGFLTGGSSAGPTSRCVVLHTTDGGATFEEVFLSEHAGELCWKFSFPSATVGYASVLTTGEVPSSFLRTRDGGATWEQLPLVEGRYASLGIGFLSEDIGWIGGEGAGRPAYRTTDGGDTWTEDDSLGPYINRFRFVDEHLGYAIGSTVYRIEVP